MGFRPNTKGNPKQPKTGISSAYNAKKKYIRKTRKMHHKTRSKTNAYTIASLLKRVRINELDKHGCLQTNKHLARIVPSVPAYPSALFDVRTQYPLLFNVNNFASQPPDVPIVNTVRAPIFQMKGTSGVAIPTTVGDFQRYNYQGVGPAGDADKTSLWLPKNQDIPDTGKYYAQSSVYRIQLSCQRPARVSIIFFTQKSLSIPTSSLSTRNLILPEALDGLNSMASGNYLPKSGFKIYKQYTKLLDATRNQSSTVNTFHFEFNHNRLMNQFATIPATVDTDTPYPLVGWNYKNVPALQPLWCLISSNQLGEPGDTALSTPVFCEIIRTVKWRDPIGADN